MQTINKKISLEPLITRFPVCYPSLSDGEILYYGDGEVKPNNAFYGYIPLGVSNDVVNFSTFTNDFNDKYGDCVLDCYTLQKWFNEFLAYYGLLRSAECRGEVFLSAVEYFEATGQYIGSGAEEMDSRIESHGGINFYKWLINNYFITLDLIGSYNDGIGCTYTEWISYVDNIGTRYMPFVHALQFSAKMNKWSELYDGVNCSDVETCCDCVDYYSYGGKIMSDFLNEWIESRKKNIISINESISGLTEEKRDKLIPSTNINIPILDKFEDLGPYVEFCKEFQSDVTCVKGSVCSYNGDVYLLTGDTYNEETFIKDDGWIRYYDREIEHGDSTYVNQLSGRTISNLESFVRDDLLVDLIGNKLPGHYGETDSEEDSEDYIAQPPEGEIIDFMYIPGTYKNITEYKKENDNVTIYTCDLLYKIEFYAKDLNGEIIKDEDGKEIRIVITQDATSGSTVDNDIKEAIKKCNELRINSIDDESDVSNQNSTHIDYSDPIYADFYTYVDVPVYIEDDGKIRLSEESLNGNKPKYGPYVICIDRCKIFSSYCQYYMADSTSYPLEYYNVELDIDTIYSNETHDDIDIYACDFIFDISGFTKTYVEMPLIRKEELLPFSHVENPVDNIYINRGYATALDKHLRIGEINDCDELEKYGNGLFSITNINE